MPYPLSIGLILLAMLGITPSARADNPVNSPLGKAVVENDLARMKTLLVERHSQDELDFALIAAADKGRPEVARLLLASGAEGVMPNIANRISPMERG